MGLLRVATAIALIAAAGVTVTCASSDVGRYRLVYVRNNLRTDRDVALIRDVARRAAEQAFNGIVLAAGFDGFAARDDAYARRLREIKAACDSLDIEIIPRVFSIGYAIRMLERDCNLAAGFPVKDARFVVSGGSARFVPGPPTVVDFEAGDGDRVAGLDFQDAAGVVSFLDRNVYKEGRASLRLEHFTQSANRHGRIIKRVSVTPFRCYRVTLWARVEGLEPKRRLYVVARTDDGRVLARWGTVVSRERDWIRIAMGFNSLSYDSVRVDAGIWDGTQGRVWLDDLRIEEAGLVNVLRRPGTPITVRREADGEILEEGRDYRAISDEQLDYRFGHGGPAIDVIPGGRIHDGDRLRVDYYHGLALDKMQVAVCMSEPKAYALWAEELAMVRECLAPSKYLIGCDEIRQGGWCAACEASGLDGGALVGSCITKLAEMIREHQPDAEIFAWSDMLDPNHNAKAVYHTVRGTLVGSWEHVPRDLIIVCWKFATRAESLAHFDSLGFRTVAGAYYDASSVDGVRDNAVGWLTALARTQHGCGIMYTTWREEYRGLERFGGYVREHLAPSE